MSRNKINFGLDALSFVVLLALTFTGIIMRYVLPPGTGGMGRMLHGGSVSGARSREFWSMTRHSWGDLHFYLSVVFVLLIAAHVLMHWKWIKGYITSAAGRKEQNFPKQ